MFQSSWLYLHDFFMTIFNCLMMAFPKAKTCNKQKEWIKIKLWLTATWSYFCWHFHAYVASLFINFRTIYHTPVSIEMLSTPIIPNVMCPAGSVCCWLKNVVHTLFIIISSTALGGPWTPPFFFFFWGFITIFFYGVGMLASHPTPHLEDQGIPFCLSHHPWPVWHGRPYP